MTEDKIVRFVRGKSPNGRRSQEYLAGVGMSLSFCINRRPTYMEGERRRSIELGEICCLTA
jgi:hypothetical protein